MRTRSTLLAFLASVCLVSLAPAQGTTPPDATTRSTAPATLPESVSRDAIRARLETLTEDDATARELLNQALAQLERRAQMVARTEESKRRAAEAEPLLAEIKRELATAPEAIRPEVPADATLSTVEQRAAEATAELELARAQAAELAAEATRRQERREAIPGAIAQARQRLGELGTPAPVPGAEAPPADAARAIRDWAERAALDAEVAALQAELAEYDARRELLPARRDRAARRVTRAEQAVGAWQNLVSAKRKQDAEREAAEAARLAKQTQGQHPVLRAYADHSRSLAEQRTQATGLPQKTTEARGGVTAADAALRTIRTQYRAVRERIVASGLTRATGLLLRRHYEELSEGITNPEDLRSRLRQVRRELEQAESIRFEREDAREAYRDIDLVVDELMSRVADSSEEVSDPEAARAVARDLASARRDLLTILQDDAGKYAAELATLERSLATLLDAVEAYEGYIRERILWVRSVPKADGRRLSDIASAVRPLRSVDAWRETLARARAGAASGWPALLAGGAAVVLLFLAARWARLRLKQISGKVSRFRTDSYALTLGALGLTVIKALPIAALLVFSGSFIRDIAGIPIAGRALGEGLRAAGLAYAPLAFAFGVFRGGGLADAHFRWPLGLVRALSGAGRWLVPLAALGAGTLAVADAIGSDASISTLGRVAFTTLWGGVAFAAILLVRPGGPVVALVQRRGGWTERARALWLPLIPAAPLALIVLAWLGYFYTARQLAERLEVTLALAGALLIVHGMLGRWLFVARRRVAVEDAKRRREQAVGEKQEAGKPSEGVQPAIDEDKLDLPAISQQTQQLFRAGLLVVAVIGLYGAWAETLPALRVLDRVQVYPEFRVEEGEDTETVPILEGSIGSVAAAGSAASSAAQGSSGGSGSQAARPAGQGEAPEAVRPMLTPPMGSPASSGEGGAEPADDTPRVSVADVLLGFVLAIATLVAFRNLPGFVEIFVLQRLPLDAGSRYALSTVLRYVIAIIGIAAAFGAINIGWRNIQWLAAALTFGLAFGLQEIFANFVSGLIILAERPIRIGDTVTVGTVNGTVTRIRMRATTITDWDRKELIIPNKAFITGDVINWTLSDPVLRLTIPVGVSYGADIREAERVLQRVADEMPDVLRDPAPFVHFRSFGDSTLNFELRIYLPHVEKLLFVRHEAHMRITEAFREAGIEIAFPQRDLHIRSAPGLEGLAESARLATDRGAPGAR